MHTLYNILQSSGQVSLHFDHRSLFPSNSLTITLFQALTKGWPLVLSTVMAVAINNDSDLIADAFKSAQLICTDFLGSLNNDNTALYITTISSFTTQTADINICLTAINLLMDVADYVANKKLSTTENQEEIGSFYNQLWTAVFSQLKLLGSDARYEVRNCAAQTLFKTLTTHGKLFDAAIWNTIVWQVIGLDFCISASCAQISCRLFFHSLLK